MKGLFHYIVLHYSIPSSTCLSSSPVLEFPFPFLQLFDFLGIKITFNIGPTLYISSSLISFFKNDRMKYFLWRGCFFRIILRVFLTKNVGLTHVLFVKQNILCGTEEYLSFYEIRNIMIAATNISHMKRKRVLLQIKYFHYIFYDS